MGVAQGYDEQSIGGWAEGARLKGMGALGHYLHYRTQQWGGGCEFGKSSVERGVRCMNMRKRIRMVRDAHVPQHDTHNVCVSVCLCLYIHTVRRCACANASLLVRATSGDLRRGAAAAAAPAASGARTPRLLAITCEPSPRANTTHTDGRTDGWMDEQATLHADRQTRRKGQTQDNHDNQESQDNEDKQDGQDKCSTDTNTETDKGRDRDRDRSRDGDADNDRQTRKCTNRNGMTRTAPASRRVDLGASVWLSLGGADL